MNIPNYIYLFSMACIFFAPFAAGQDKADPASTIVEKFDVVDEVEENYERDFSGHRIGIGLSNASYLDDNMYVFDYGYEFNRYLGFMLSGSRYDDEYEADISDNTFPLDFDGTYTRVAFDLGYTFEFQRFDVKPYLLTGILYMNESNTLSSNSSTAFQYGLGARFTLKKGIYFDLSYRSADVDNWMEEEHSRDGEEALLTVGYKF